MKVKPSSRNESLIRLNKIYTVLKKNDFGYVIEQNTFLKKFPFMRNRKIKESKSDNSVSIRLRKVLEELGPAYIKLGQMLSTRPDLVGLEIAKELQKLRDDTPATPFPEIKEVIEKELGKPLDEVYKDFNETPIGSASIGQVYEAVLIENDEKVAVKVQKPNIKKVIETDLEIMEFLGKKMDKHFQQTRSFNIPAIIYEFKHSIMEEINYENELMNMKHLAYNFRHVDYIHIPQTYDDYCGKKIITMELVKGVEVSKIFDRDDLEYDKKLIARRGVSSYLKQIFIDGFFHADPHPSNIMIMKNNVICYIDEGMMGTLDETFKKNLASLMLLLKDGNAEHILNQLFYMEIIDKDQKEDPIIKDDVNQLMNRYYGADLKKMNGVLEDLIQVMMKHGVILPREFVMIGRGVTLIEESGQRLDPDLNIAEELEKFSFRIFVHQYNPKRLIKSSQNYLLEIEHLAKNLPTRIDELFEKVENGEITINIRVLGIEKMLYQLSVAIVLAALLIGSSLAIFSRAGPEVFDISIFGVIGFVFSVILAIYLLIVGIKYK
ncbi:MAG: AarF/ABC1/UbiB kinase family protein [Methanobrevibacter sp.]|nr:AarF/ABC1/UbiB kinase family protein [Methanobrevibacter sp.]